MNETTVGHLGVNPDPRPADAKEFDYKHEEIFTSAVVTADTYLKSYKDAAFYVNLFPIDDQHGTSSCVAHGKCLVMSIFNWLQAGPNAAFRQLSSMFLYRMRVNFPGAGMIPSSANMQTIKVGVPIYADLETPETESEADAIVINDALIAAAKEFAGGKWVTFTDPKDVDQMAFVSNSLGLPLNILIYATTAEWSQSVVKILTPNLSENDPRAIVRHCITILPKSAYIENGVKHVVIQDSAGFGGIFFRSVEEGFLRARVYQTDYMIAMGSVMAMTEKPKYVFNTDLAINSNGPDVTALQECLQYLGFFPNVVNGQPFKPTGYFGGMTKNAVLKFQNAYAEKILTPVGLTTGTGRVGPSTRTCLNGLFD